MKNNLIKILYILKRKWRKFLRLIRNKNQKGCTFSILVVKRVPYVELAINNINSLHYLNSNHQFVIYCDDICETELKKSWKKFDYPQKIKLYNKFKNQNQSWQHSKIETIIDASKKGTILIDADGIWHQEPKIDPEKIVFQVSPNKIKEKKDEFEVVKNIFNKPEWGEFRYYTSAFVSIPPKYMTDEIADQTRKYLEILFNHSYEFLENQDSRNEQKRQSEQFAINLALLTNYPAELFSVLKKEDGPKNKDFVQPLYYGCSNHIFE